MGDERCEIGPNVAVKGSLENQCSMNSTTTATNTNTNTTPTTTTTNANQISTNVTNNNNNEEQDAFLPITTTTNNAHYFSANTSNNTTSNNNEQDRFLPIPTVTNSAHPFSTNPSNNNNNNEQDRFLPISTGTNNIQHFSSDATTKSSSNKEQDQFLPISTSTNNAQHFSTNSNNSSSTTSNNKEQDRFLPIANVGRIMKKFIPGNGKISKDAKETVQECVSEFISFVTGEASDKCQREKRKTINGDDIIWAITTLGFEDYVTPLKQYLNKYRELEGEKINVPKQQRLQQHDQKPNMSYHSVYSSTSLLSQPSFVPSDQPFPLPFSQTSIQTQLPQHEHIDSVGNW